MNADESVQLVYFPPKCAAAAADVEKDADEDKVIQDLKHGDTVESGAEEHREKKQTLIYGINDNPPFGLTLLLAFQQTVVSIPKVVFVIAILSEIVCATELEDLKTRMFATTILLSGLCTFCQSTFGVRLPLFQGPVTYYMVPMLALSSLPEWKCPNYLNIISENSSLDHPSNSLIGNYTFEKHLFEEEHVFPKLRVLQGSLMLAGIVHMLVGMTGVIGILLRYIGPLTVVPTLILVGIPQAMILGKFCEPSWVVATTTVVSTGIFAMYLDGRNIPVPIWSKSGGFNIVRYPLHKILSILIGIIIGYSLSAILTVTDVFSDDPTSVDYRARTDFSLTEIYTSPWFCLPYPGQYGSPTFSIGIFITYLIPTLISILDSIADYYACAEAVRAPPPPFHAVSRGLAVEGFFSFLAGGFGAGHGTTTYGSNIGIIGMTKVGSRQVFQMFGIQLITVAIIGKLSAFFVALPYPVIGGSTIVLTASFMGIIFSNLSHVNLNSTRNLIVIGMALILGLMIPNWAKQNVAKFETGSQHLTDLIRIMMTNSNFIGMLVAFFLDNTLPGTRKDRGLLAWTSDGNGEEAETSGYEETTDVYEIPCITKLLTKFRITRFIPISPTFRRK